MPRRSAGLSRNEWPDTPEYASILLDVHLYFIYDNAKSWYFQTGWKIVDRLVHGGEADLLESALELES